MLFWQFVTSEEFVRVAATLFMLFGLAVLLMPILPGLVIIWLAAFGYGMYALLFDNGVSTLGWVMFAIMTVLMVIGSFADNVLMGTTAHKEGAPWWVVLLALVAAIPGNLLLPIIGGVLAALLTIFLLEWARLKDANRAFTSMRGLLVGCGWAVGIRFIIGMVMIGLWLIWAWV